MVTFRSVAAELETSGRELLADFVETRHAEVLAFEQVVASAPDNPVSFSITCTMDLAGVRFVNPALPPIDLKCWRDNP